MFNRKLRKRKSGKINSGSMADIAFLLLIFFLMTTTIQSDKGLNVKLPPDSEDEPIAKIHERNLFKVLVNSKNKILVEGAAFKSYSQLKNDAKTFVMNRGNDPRLSDTPKDAIISLKVDRGSRYEIFIDVMDALQGAYYEIYSERVGLTPDAYRSLDTSIPEEREKYLQGRKDIPMNISLAEPTNIY